jgi:hypothetical protein
MATKIVFNGSKHAGQEPDSVDVLLALLSREPLEPRHELIGGGFVHAGLSAELTAHYGVAARGAIMYTGNFRNVSHAFSVVTDEKDLQDRLSAAVTENMNRPDYRRLYAEEYAEQKKKAEKAGSVPWKFPR